MKRRMHRAAEAHTNLSMYGAIISLCESGSFYTARPHNTLRKIIRMCKEQQQRELEVMDKATGRTARAVHQATVGQD